MRAMIMLCDFAQVADRKLYILGGGWNLMGFPPPPSAVVLRLEIPEDQAEEPVEISLDLVDSDGHPVLNNDPAGPQPVRVGLSGHVSREDNTAPPGSPLEVSFAVNFPSLPVAPGGRYTWNLRINGQTQEGWHADFSVQSADGPT